MFHSPSDDERVVAEAMTTLARASVGHTTLPDPSFIWWKAQLLRRLEAERSATAAIEVGERFHLGAVLLGGAALIVGLWDHLPTLALSPVTGLTLACAFVMLVSVVAVATWDVLRH